MVILHFSIANDSRPMRAASDSQDSEYPRVCAPAGFTEGERTGSPGIENGRYLSNRRDKGKGDNGRLRAFGREKRRGGDRSAITTVMSGFLGTHTVLS